ncbi:MAG: PadR family transcriptional regulator [Homoserinimonas sp.]
MSPQIDISRTLFSDVPTRTLDTATIGPYQVQAAIAPVHDEAANAAVMEVDTKLATLRRSVLEPLVLATIEPTHPYAAEIVTALRDGGIPVQEGTYPLLAKLRRDGLVEHEWRESAAGPPREYFTLTDAGRAQLAEFRDYWAELTRMIETIGRW